MVVPSDWTISPTSPNGFLTTATFRNYDPSLLDNHQTLPSSALKIEFQVYSIPPELGLSEWPAQYINEITRDSETQKPLLQAAFSEDFSLGAHTVKQIRLERESDGEYAYAILAIRLSPGKILNIITSPDSAWLQPDVRNMLGTLVLSKNASIKAPDQIQLPVADFNDASALPLDEVQAVIWPCSRGNEVGGSPISLQMPFSAGTTWSVGGNGSYYGDGAHVNVNNDYYATDWNMGSWPSTVEDYGQSVYPVAGGTAYVGSDGNAGYGTWVDVYHDGGQVKTRYAHLSSVSIQNNSVVTVSTKIGGVGSTGNSSSNHLHLSFWFKVNGGWNSTYGQGRRPSPMQTTSGSWELCDGESRTVANKSGTNNPPAGFAWCSNENGRCNFNGTADVVYGALNSFTSPRSFTNGVDCNNGVFGDPISGTGKACYYKSTGGGGTGLDCGQVSYPGVVLYEHATCNRDTGGVTKAFSSSTGWIDIVSDPIHDKTSSIYVAPGWSIKVFEAATFDNNGGSWRCVTGSMWDLNIDYYTNGNTGQKINDTISSLQVYGPNNSSCNSSPPSPDLVIQSITATPTNPSINQLVTITVRVKNQGAGNVTSSFYVDLFVDAQPGSCPDDGITYWTINSLVAGAYLDLTYSHPGFSTSGTHNLYAFADSYCSIAESNDGNNTLGPVALNVQQTQPPVGPGTYENTNTNWALTGLWTNYTLSGASGGTLHFGTATSSTASLKFTGAGRFTLRYLRYSGLGLLNVYLDGVKIITLNQSGTFAWLTYTRTLSAGTHTIKLTDASGTVNFDKIVIAP